MAAPVGLGAWIAYRRRIGDPQKVAEVAKQAGFSWLAVRIGYGGMNDRDFKLSDIQAYKAAGIAQVFVWAYALPYAIGAEIVAYKKCVDAGADGVFIDAETEYNNKRLEAQSYGKLFRQSMPSVWVADCPWPMIALHGDYPNEEFAEWVDARAAQVYWTEISAAGANLISKRYEEQWESWEARARSKLVKPRIPIGVSYGNREKHAAGVGSAPGELSISDLELFLTKYDSAASSLYTLEMASQQTLDFLASRVPGECAGITPISKG